MIKTDEDSKIITQGVVLLPAYGRDYGNAAKAQEAFEQGKDWQLAFSGQYCSIRDFASGVSVELRYARKMKSVIITVP